jgi:hypothetical protein
MQSMIHRNEMLRVANALAAYLSTGSGALVSLLNSSSPINPEATNGEIAAALTTGLAVNPKALDTWTVITDPDTGDYLVVCATVLTFNCNANGDHPAVGIFVESPAAADRVAGIVLPKPQILRTNGDALTMNVVFRVSGPTISLEVR